MTWKNFTYFPSLVNSVHPPVKVLLVHLDAHDETKKVFCQLNSLLCPQLIEFPRVFEMFCQCFEDCVCEFLARFRNYGLSRTKSAECRLVVSFVKVENGQKLRENARNGHFCVITISAITSISFREMGNAEKKHLKWGKWLHCHFSKWSMMFTQKWTKFIL